MLGPQELLERKLVFSDSGEGVTGNTPEGVMLEAGLEG